MTELMPVRITMFDGLTVRLGDGRLVADLPQGVQRLVALLGLSGRPARPAVAGRLWPDIPEELAQRRLRTTLWRTQKSLPGVVAPGGGALGLGARVGLDVRELCEWGRHVLDPASSAEQCARPHPGMYGELLPGWYDDWIDAERERLRQLRMHVWEALSDKLARAGRYGEAIEAAHEAIRAAPLRESAWRALIRAHAAEGNVDEALRAYARFEEQLGDELGIAPSGELSRLVRELAPEHAVTRRSDFWSARAGAGAAVRELAGYPVPAERPLRARRRGDVQVTPAGEAPRRPTHVTGGTLPVH